jgi:hypothetical protein
VSGSSQALAAARAEALFASSLSAYARPTAAEVAEAITLAVRRYGGTRGCAAEVAAEYGDHPETAALRMRWARQLVTAVYPVERPETAVVRIPRPRRPLDDATPRGAVWSNAMQNAPDSSSRGAA